METSDAAGHRQSPAALVVSAGDASCGASLLQHPEMRIVRKNQMMGKNRLVGWLLPALMTVALAMPAISKSTKLVASWRNPAYTGQPFHKVLVMGMSAKPEVRADFEDALSTRIVGSGVEVIPGHSILL